MRRTEVLEREVKTLRERLSRLSEASLRINETLDFGKPCWAASWIVREC